ncbi:transposase [Roseibium sp. RKSG952]
MNTHIPRQSKSAVFWSRLYFACSAGGATMDVLHKYAQNQKTPE